MGEIQSRRSSVRRQVYGYLAAFTFVFIATMLVTPLFDLTRYQLVVGLPAPRKVVARHSFKIQDHEKEQAVRTARMFSIAPKFIRDPKAEKAAMQDAARLIDSLRKAASGMASGHAREFPGWLDELAAAEAVKCADRDWVAISEAAQTLIQEFMADKGILQEAQEARDLNLHKHLRHEIHFMANGDSIPPRRVRGPPELIDMKGLAGYLESSAGMIYPNLASPRLLTAVLLRVIRPNQIFDREHFRIETDQVKREIQPIYQEYVPGDAIVRENQTVSESHLMAIREMQKADRFRLVVTALSAFALLSLATLLLIQYLRVYQSDRIRDTAWMWFIALLFLFMLGLSRLVWTLTDSRLVFAFGLPIPVYAMLLTIFYRPRVAMLSAPFLSLGVAVLYGCNFQIMVVHTITAIMSVFIVRHTRTMADIVKAGLFLGLISPVVVLASHFVMIDFSMGRRELWLSVLSAFGSGVLLVPFLTFGLVHFIPIIFGLPSDFKILELSDLNHPLLRQMLLEAPGSYQHSQAVSMLSEAACESINANSLLARVGSYYHDIGKMKKPEYFTENQKYIIDENGEIIGKETKDIKPSLYASVLKSHVKMGVELAREYRLPKILVEFIEQHHGTSIMKSLYMSALNQSSPEDPAEEESFMYPGPKPRFKETAVVMLADTVEAAIRSLHNPTPHRIEEEVRRLIQTKLEDGQLDESTLTLKDLSKIEAAFTNVLTSMYHTRIAYPSDEEIKRRQRQKGEG